MLGEGLSLTDLYPLLHDGACAICISLSLFDEGQGNLCLEDGPPIPGPFAEFDPLLEQGGCGVQVVPLVLKIPSAHIGRTYRREVSTSLQDLLKSLAIGLIC
jgi:hypothetical protein